MLPGRVQGQGEDDKLRTTVVAVGMTIFMNALNSIMPSIHGSCIWSRVLFRTCSNLHFGGNVIHDDRSQALTARGRSKGMRVFFTWLDDHNPRVSITPLQLHVLLVEARKYGSSLQLDHDEVSTGSTPVDMFYRL